MCFKKSTYLNSINIGDKKMKYRLIIFILLCITLVIHPQNKEDGTVVGRVLDAKNKEPMVGVNVYLENTGYGSSTNIDGNYSIQNVPPGKYNLIVSYVGYKKFEKKIEINGEKVIHIDVELEYSLLEGEEIVVTATRTPKVIKDVPIRTQIITPLEFKKNEAKTVYEALEYTPGIRVEQQCSNCNFSILRVEGLEGGYASTLIDGQPIFTGLAGVYGLQQIQTGNIEQIEVVKGSGSALYGSDAIGGVVNVILKEPTPIPEYNFGINIGNFGSKYFYVNGSQRKGNIGVVFSAQKDIEDEIDVSGGETFPFKDTGKDNFTDRVERNNLGVSLKTYWFNPAGENSRLTLSSRVISEYRRGGNLTTWDDPFDPDSEHIRTKRYEAGFGFKKEFTKNKFEIDYMYVDHYRNATNGAAWDKAIEGGMVDENLNFTDEGLSYIDDYGFNTFRTNWYPKPFIVQEKLHIGDIRYSQFIGETHQLLAGIQYRKSNMNQDINGEVSDKNADDMGIYLQSDLSLAKTLEVIAGLRYDMHKSEDNLTGADYDKKVFNPRFAVRWSPKTDLTIRMNIGTGYRVPYLFAEDLHLCASAPRMYKGPDLEPERSLSFSLGADIYKVEHRIGLSVFRTNIQDKVEFISPDDGDVPEGYDYKWSNVGDAYTQGFEITYSGLAFEDVLEYSFNIVYTDARFEELRYTQETYPTDNDGWKNSDRIPRSPSLTGNTSFGFNLQNGWQIFTNFNYTGSMYIDHVPGDDAEQLIIEKTDPFVLINAKVSKKINQRLSIFLGAKNLFDYTQPTRDNSDAAYMYAPLYGRIVYSGFDVAIK